MGESRFTMCFVLIYFLFVISFPKEKGGNVSPLATPASEHTHQGNVQGVLQKNEAGNLLLLTFSVYTSPLHGFQTFCSSVSFLKPGQVYCRPALAKHNSLFPTQLILYTFLS